LPTEWIDVADTAVKIGLGALITGFFTYLGIKLTKNSEKQKFLLEHKVKMLEQISEDIESYFRALDSYTAKVAGITKHKQVKGEERDPFTVEQIKSIKERDLTLSESWAAKKSAISKMRLVGANEAVESLVKFSSYEKDLRDKIVFEKKVPLYEEVELTRTNITDQKKILHGELADFYEGLQ